MNLIGLLVGLSTFLIIGLFHPLVIKAEYYIGVKSWVLFAVAGVAFAVACFNKHNCVHPQLYCGLTRFWYGLV